MKQTKIKSSQEHCWIAFITKGHIFYRFFSNQGLLESHVFAFPIRASNRCFLYVDLLFLWLSAIIIIINIIMIILPAFASKLSSKLSLSINTFYFILHLKIELSLNLPCDTSLQSVNLNKTFITANFPSSYFYYM